MIKELGSATNHDVFTLSTVSKHLKHNGIDVADLCLFKESGAKCLNGICKILSLRYIDINALRETGINRTAVLRRTT